MLTLLLLQSLNAGAARSCPPRARRRLYRTGRADAPACRSSRKTRLRAAGSNPGGNARDSVLTYANKTDPSAARKPCPALSSERAMCWPRTAPGLPRKRNSGFSLNRRLFPIRSACRRVDGTAGSPDCRPSTGAAFRPAAPRYRPGTRPPCASAANAIFPRRIRALALAPAKQGRYLLVAFLLTMLYLLLHSALSLVFALVSFVLAMLCARENQKAFRL